MKRIVVSLAVLLAACDNNTRISKVVRHLRPDTTRTVTVYTVNPDSGKLGLAFTWRIIKDSIMPTTKDGGQTYQSTIVADTSYYIPQVVALVDSLGKPMKNASGLPLYRTDYFLISDSLIVGDFNKNYRFHIK